MKTRDRSLGSSRTITLLVSLVLVSLALILLSQNPQFAPVQSFLQNLIAPVQRTVADGTRQVNGWMTTLQHMNTLQQRVDQLETEIARLKSENTQLQDLRAENEQLRRTLGFQNAFPELTIMPANVIGSDPTGLSQVLIIDRGFRDGVREGMAVTSPGGYLVGKIRDVTADRSNVLLVTDISSSISIVVERNNVSGTVQGQAQSGGRLLVQHIPQGADVRVNDLIKTSGVGGTMPKGLLLGQITEVHQRDVEMEQEALAYPLIELELATLDQVLVLTSSGPPEAQPTAPAVAPTPALTLTLTVPAETPAPTSTPGS